MADREALARRLSTAVSVAISEALATQEQTQHIPSGSAAANQLAPNLPAVQTQAQASRFPLPSISSRGTAQPPAKRRRTAVNTKKKIYSKTVICLPPSKKITSSIPIPRGESRATLQEAGLVGKASIDSSWKARDIAREITSLFGPSFGVVDEEILPFHYLSTLPGTKKLCIPKTSSSFVWDASQVLSICSRDTLYIMSNVEPLRSLNRNDETGNSDLESEDDSFLYQPVFTENTPKDSNPPSVGQPDSDQTSNHPDVGGPTEVSVNRQPEGTRPQTNPDLFRAYVSLIDEDVDIDPDYDDDDGDKCDGGDWNADSAAARNNKTLSEILQELQIKINTDEACYINARRSAIWSDTCRQLMRKRFSTLHRVSVKFADNEGKSEGAIDVGGPKREFFRLLVKAANEDSGIFIGPEGCRSLYPNSFAREKDFYRLVGVVLAWSLVHGGPGGNFFCPTLFNAIAYGPDVKLPRLEDVPDPELKEIITQIINATTIEELQGYLNDQAIQQILDAQGASPVPSSLDKKEWYGKVITRHILVDSTRFLLDDLKKGLQTLGVLDVMQANPEQFREVFTKENMRPLDAQTVDVLFSIDFAEQGSNERTKQELSIVYWRDYLQDCESGDAQATLGDVLAFATAADVPPTLGFDTIPTILFTDTAFPTANTCSTTLRLPTIYESYDDFKEKMDYSILNSPCFGQK